MARAAVFGASGSMGRCVVNSLARDGRIGTVVAVVRTEQPAAFWFLEGDPAWAKVRAQRVLRCLALTYTHAPYLTRAELPCLDVHTRTVPNAASFIWIGGGACRARHRPDADDQV